MSDCTVSRRFPCADSWEAIARQIESGNDGYINLGDEINFSLKDDTPITVQAAALSPYGGSTVAFVMKDLLPWRECMNARNESDGGYASSEMRRWIEEEIQPKLPDQLLAVIKPRTIRQVMGNREFSTEQKLWLPSRKEIFDRDDETAPDDAFFPLFSTQKSRIKALGNGEPYWYWLRSPYGDDGFCCVYNGGGNGYNDASFRLGVALSFLI